MHILNIPTSLRAHRFPAFKIEIDMVKIRWPLVQRAISSTDVHLGQDFRDSSGHSSYG